MRFDDSLIAAYRVLFERRDMRHFTAELVDPAVFARLIRAAHRPSCSPGGFIRVTERALRERIYAIVEAERQDEFMHLKVEGIGECGEVLVVALGDDH